MEACSKYRSFGFCYRGAPVVTRRTLEKSGHIKEAYGVEVGGVHYVCLIFFQGYQHRLASAGKIPYLYGVLPAAVVPDLIGGSDCHVSIYMAGVRTTDPILAMLKRPSDVKWRWHCAPATPKLARLDDDAQVNPSVPERDPNWVLDLTKTFLTVYMRDLCFTETELMDAMPALEVSCTVRLNDGRWVCLLGMKQCFIVGEVYWMVRRLPSCGFCVRHFTDTVDAMALDIDAVEGISDRGQMVRAHMTRVFRECEKDKYPLTRVV